jgi:aryl-alcohol dehydrogenase-like predicted oxidoreductase
MGVIRGWFEENRVSEPRAPLSRRDFLQASAAGALLAGAARHASAAEPLPTRTLGRTGVKVPIVGLGTACVGQARPVSFAEARRTMEEAIDQGITYLDSARGYDKAEDVLGEVLAGRREQVFLTTKAGAGNAAGQQRSFDDSLRRLKCDHVDLLYWHEAGHQDTKRGLEPDGVMDWLQKQKDSGKARFIGVTCHMRGPNVVPLLESGRCDVLMTVLNFVDRFQYHFDETLLPAARKHNMGIVAMKVFGGERGSNWNRYNGANPGPQMDEELLDRALRFSLSIEGVACAVVGMHTPEQVRQNAARARAMRPLSADEAAELEQLGRSLVTQWGPRFGPVS